ncbi:DUF2341 domain-containing protein [Methanothermococcus okinawensis]|nr:DUF2341 domain-containing protein [Methanothermococcus okinawensis]
MFKSKIKSKKGYIFTYEAIIVSIIFVMVFYIGSMAYTHNFLTALETKKDIDEAHNSLLLKDYYLKKYSFPGDFYNNSGNFKEHIVDSLRNNNLKTFDIYHNFSDADKKMYFIIYPNKYDEELYNSSANITNNNYILNITFDKSNITCYTNVADKIKTKNSINNLNKRVEGRDITVFHDVVYIPLITMDNNSQYPNGYKAYGSNGDIIYFYISGVNKDFSARILTNNRNRFRAYADWKYASPINVHSFNQNGYYDVKVVFDSQTYINDGEMNKYCKDVRFLDENGNSLNYWIEPQTINTHHTIAWVKMDLIPNEHTIIYMLYGNPNAESESNGENTFEFFDNFSSGHIDTNKWNKNFNENNFRNNWNLFKNGTYPNGINYTYLRLNYSAYTGANDWIRIYSKDKYGSIYAVKFHVKFHKKYDEWAGFYYGNNNDYNRQIISNYHWGGDHLRFESSKDNDNDIDYSILPMSLYDNWNAYEIQRDGMNSVNLIINDSENNIYQRNAYIYDGDMPISFVARRYDTSTGGYTPPENEKNGYIDIDWVFVRPYISEEPVLSYGAPVVFSINGKVFSKNMKTTFTSYDDVKNELNDGLNEIRILHSDYPIEFNLGNGNGGQFQTITFSPRNISIVVVK